MEKKYQIIYDELFDKDFESILIYIRNELKNEIAASNLANLVWSEIENRAKNPIIYEQYKSYKNRDEIFYKLYIKNYTVFYVVTEDTMEIRRMIYSKRNLDKLIY